MASKLRRVRKVRWLKRMRTHWFFARMATKDGRNVLAKRRAKWRHALTVQMKDKHPA